MKHIFCLMLVMVRSYPIAPSASRISRADALAAVISPTIRTSSALHGT